jgi:streptogramin lyase
LKAGLNRPHRCVVDNVGNLLIADLGNRRVRLIDLVTRTITTYAGSGHDGNAGDGGPALQASFGEPAGIGIGKNGDVYIADRAHNVVRKVDAASGIVTTVAGGALRGPLDVAVAPDGRVLIADTGANRVCVVGPGGEVSTLAGSLVSPASVACDASGNVYVCEQPAHRVRRITPAGALEPFAGTGVPGNSGDTRPASAATLREPSGVTVDAAGNVLIADTGNHAIRFVERATGNIYTVAGGRRGYRGDGHDASAAALDTPSGCAIDADGYIYIADTNNNRIRSVVSAATEDDGFTEDDGLARNARLGGGGRRGRGDGPGDDE